MQVVSRYYEREDDLFHKYDRLGQRVGRLEDDYRGLQDRVTKLEDDKRESRRRDAHRVYETTPGLHAESTTVHSMSTV